MDIRVSRTQKMLLDAFEELVSEKSMEDISVSELCELSTVRRNTFYRHFGDKYAFIEFYLQSLAERFMVQAESGYDLEELSDYAKHMHKALIRFIELHQGSMKNAMGQKVLVSTVDMIIKQVAEGITLRAARGIDHLGSKPNMPVELLGFFYSAGMVHTLRWWYFEGKPVAPELLEEYCTDFLMRCYARFVEENGQAN